MTEQVEVLPGKTCGMTMLGSVGACVFTHASLWMIGEVGGALDLVNQQRARAKTIADSLIGYLAASAQQALEIDPGRRNNAHSCCRSARHRVVAGFHGGNAKPLTKTPG